MIDRYELAQLPRDKSLTVSYGPRRPTTCAINGCPVDEHSYSVKLPGQNGHACVTCASDHSFELDWSRA